MMMRAYAVATAAQAFHLVLAQQTNPVVPDWLNTTVGVGTLVLLLWLWLSGRLVRAGDVDKRVAIITQAHEQRITDSNTAHNRQIADQNAAHQAEIKAIRETAAALVLASTKVAEVANAQAAAAEIDKDAWRKTAAEEAASRALAERALSTLMDNSTMSVGLLDAIRQIALRRTDVPS